MFLPADHPQFDPRGAKKISATSSNRVLPSDLLQPCHRLRQISRRLQRWEDAKGAPRPRWLECSRYCKTSSGTRSSEIIAFLAHQSGPLSWTIDRLIKEPWAMAGNRIAARFAYAWHDDSDYGIATTNRGFTLGVLGPVIPAPATSPPIPPRSRPRNRRELRRRNASTTRR
jgi:hypothetical protein